jgi:hypothetical protein
VPALAEIHLVSDPDDLSHPLRLQMISLSDHLADLREPAEAAAFNAAERIRLEVRNDVFQELADRTDFIFEGPIGS